MRRSFLALIFFIAAAIPALGQEPGLRLALQSGRPALIGDVVVSTTIYYTPYTSGFLPMPAGAIYTPELSLALDANHADQCYQVTNNLYDLFVFYDSSNVLRLGAACMPWMATGVPVVGLTVTAPIAMTIMGSGVWAGMADGFVSGAYWDFSGANGFWTLGTRNANSVWLNGSSGAGNYGSDAIFNLRGSGPGTSELTQDAQGRDVNAQLLVIRFGTGSTDYTTVAAGAALYVGSFYTTGDGTTQIDVAPYAQAGGTYNIIGLWNRYNRIPIEVTEQDAQGWNYPAALNGASGPRLLNGSAANSIRFIDGKALSPWHAKEMVTVSTTSATPSAYTCGMMLDATPAGTFFAGPGMTLNQYAAAAGSSGSTIECNLTGRAMLGFHQVFAGEASTSVPMAVNGNGFTGLIFAGEY